MIFYAEQGELVTHSGQPRPAGFYWHLVGATRAPVGPYAAADAAKKEKDAMVAWARGRG